MGQHELDRLLLRSLQFLAWKTGGRSLIRRGGKQTQDIVYPAYKNIITAVVVGLRQIAPERYTDADPFKKIMVDPQKIAYKTDDTFRHRGWVVGGDWDQNRTPIDKTILYQALKRRFLHGESWDESGYIEFAYQEISNNTNSWSMSCPSKINKRCMNLDDLWKSIKQSGYKSQDELVFDNRSCTYDSNIDEIHPILNEIGIDIDRNGEFLWNRVGQHRLIIAQLLGIESVPVLIYRRHTKWQQNRDYFRTESKKIKCDQSLHPDLAELVNN